MLEEVDIYVCQKMKNTTSILFGLIQPASNSLEWKNLEVQEPTPYTHPL